MKNLVNSESGHGDRPSEGYFNAEPHKDMYEISEAEALRREKVAAQLAKGIIPPPSFEAWAWARLLTMLDKAGYAIVRKPSLIERGRPHPPGP